MYSVVQVNSDGTIELRNPWGCNPIDPQGPEPGLHPGRRLHQPDQTAQALNDMQEIRCSATVPTVNPTPTPTPTPTPHQRRHQRRHQPRHQRRHQHQHRLRHQHAVAVRTIRLPTSLATTPSCWPTGDYVDAYVVTATSGTVNIAVGSNEFMPQMEVLDRRNGNVGGDGPEHALTAERSGVSFNATPGQQYEVAIAGEYWGQAATESCVQRHQHKTSNSARYGSCYGSAKTGSAAPATGTSVASQIFSQTPILG